MKIHQLNKSNSIFNHFLSEIRDISIQNDRLRFRRNIERIGEVMAYEISKELDYKTTDIKTPLGVAKENLFNDNVVIASILRAGLPLHQGFLNYFDKAENTFVSAYRKHTSENDFEIKIEYLASPSLEGKTVILCDPMLATGGSFLLSYEAILSKGKPAHIHIASIVASQQGVDKITSEIKDSNVTLWTGTIDPSLNEKSYIVPGLGDAGDLAYGSKDE